MAHLLIGWELGHGMGHLMPLRMVGEALLAQGHRLTFVVRDTATAARALSGLPVQWLQAPLVPYFPWEIGRTDCYSELLGNVGLGNPEQVAATVDAWLALIDAIAPDGALLEFSPSAMLACHVRGLPFALQGNGFFCPPADADPFGVLNPKQTPTEREAADARLLTNLNALLAERGVTPLASLAALYGEARTVVLTTFAELDHFPNRQNAIYSGPWLPAQTSTAEWPDGKGAKIFAYLMPRPGVEHLLDMLARSGLPALVYGPGLTEAVRAGFTAPTLRYLDGLVDVGTLARESDLGIFHGAHSTTAAFLLAGKPSLQIPLYTEQLMFARRLRAMEAGEIATLDQPERIAAALNAMLRTDAYRQGAQRFAERHRGYNPAAAIAEAADRISATVLAPGAAGTNRQSQPA